MSFSWSVIHTQPLKEIVAKQHLIAQGYEVYLPRFKKLCKHARKVEEKLVPLFPRYIFVKADLDVCQWRSINGTRGVSYLLMSSDLNPAKVPDFIIGELKAQEITDGIVPINSLVNFIKGEKIRITEGVFKDQIATFEFLDDKSRAQLLLNFMGRQMKMKLPLYAVEAA